MFYRNYFKPVVDSLSALIFLLLLSPLFLFVFITLLFANKGKPFFFQPRPGKNERIFKIIKFKTMNEETDNNDNLLPDKDRLTPIGSFVRKTSLDEIPNSSML